MKSLSKFRLTSQEQEILLQLEECSNLREIGEALACDVSVVSRKLQKLLAETSFVVKNEQKWQLTKMGLRFNQWTRGVLSEQEKFFSQREVLRIGAPREFIRLVLVKHWQKFASLDCCLEWVGVDEPRGVELLLLDSKIDFGYDCVTPQSPLIRFKRGPKESYAFVTSSPYEKSMKAEEVIEERAYFHFHRILLPLLNHHLKREIKAEMIFSDMLILKTFLLNDAPKAWTFLPRYAVEEEIQKGQLFPLNFQMDLDFGHISLLWKSDHAPPPMILDLLNNKHCKI